MGAINFKANAAHGLDAPRRTHWAEDAACNRANNPGVDPEWFWPIEHYDASQTTRLAVHVCRQHCPVVFECRRDATENPPKHPVVVGGERYSAFGGGGTGKPRPIDLVVSDTCTGCPYCAGSTS